MKDVSFSWNEMLFSIHRITNLELLRTLMLCLVQTKQMKRMQGHGCWKASFSVRESCKMQF